MSEAADGLPPIGELIREHGLSAQKSLGQNFILDLNLTRKIARAAGPLEDTTVIEIGSGPGGLTRALLHEGARHVVAIEPDTRCEPVLQLIADHYPGRLTLVQENALSLDLSSFTGTRPARIVANLPYNVGSELLVGWLKAEPWPPWYDRMVLMFQKEVADRIVSAPGSKTYGRLSVISQWRCHCRTLMTLGPKAFTPAPKVDSSVVEFIPRQSPSPAGSTDTLQKVTAAAFGQRRKMLRQSLKSTGVTPETLLEKAGIEGTLRAENLSVEQFCSLALAMDQ